LEFQPFDDPLHADEPGAPTLNAGRIVRHFRLHFL
jgi:hypothetical protein